MTSSAGDQDARSTDEGGPATAPLTVEDVTLESAVLIYFTTIVSMPWMSIEISILPGTSKFSH